MDIAGPVRYSDSNSEGNMFILERAQEIDQPVAEVFKFFERPENLKNITPPWLDFKILTTSPIQMKKDATIEYSIRWHKIPIHWKTKILEYNPPHIFVDQQIYGPYTFWHHTHTFTETERGTLMIDVVRYVLPMWVLGDFIHELVIRKQLNDIFEYRRRAIDVIFKKELDLSHQP